MAMETFGNGDGPNVKLLPMEPKDISYFTKRGLGELSLALAASQSPGQRDIFGYRDVPKVKVLPIEPKEIFLS